MAVMNGGQMPVKPRITLAAKPVSCGGKWQPVGESNPSYLVENQVS